MNMSSTSVLWMGMLAQFFLELKEISLFLRVHSIMFVRN